MAGAEQQRPLFSEPIDTAGSVVVNDSCVLRTAHGFRVVIGSGVVSAQYAAEDRIAEAYAMVNLVEQGGATQKEVARAFGCSALGIHRHQAWFHTRGLAAVSRADSYPSGRRRVWRSHEHLVERLRKQGIATRKIARRLGVTSKAVRKVLKRLGWREPQPEQLPLPVDEAGGDANQSAFPCASMPKRPA
jgi:DNA invertase Pin-like site-specific DNA recombinase